MHTTLETNYLLHYGILVGIGKRRAFRVQAMFSEESPALKGEQRSRRDELIVSRSTAAKQYLVVPGVK
jgi:hypothetical protein